VASTLKDHLTARGEVDADVRAVDLLLDDERLVGNEALRIGLVHVLIIVCPLGCR